MTSLFQTEALHDIAILPAGLGPRSQDAKYEHCFLLQPLYVACAARPDCINTPSLVEGDCAWYLQSAHTTLELQGGSHQ